MINQLNSLIGLRTLKTAISVTLSIMVARLLGLEYPFFVGMTAIITLERTLQRSVFMGKVRVVGSAIGATVGVCMSYIYRGHPALIFIGILLVIVTCTQLHLQPAVPISGIVFLWIMVHVGNASPIFYGFHRVFDSLVGASVSCLVNLAFLPYYNMARLEKGVRRSCDTIVGIIERPDNMVDSSELVSIRSSMRELDTLMELYREEYLTAAKREQVTGYDLLYHSLCDIVTELEAIERMKATVDVTTQPLAAAGLEYHRLAVAQQLAHIRELRITHEAASVV